jgi:hypothetical protein
MVQESSLHNGLNLQNEMVQGVVSNEHEMNQLINKYSQANHVQGDKEYDLQDSNSFSSSEVTGVPEVASVKYETELIVIPEEAWSEFGDIKLIAEQDGTHQLSFGNSGYNGMQAAGLTTEKTIEKHQTFVDHKEKEFSAAGSNKFVESEESDPNGAPEQDGLLNTDLPGQQAQQDDGEYCGSGDKSRELSSALAEELENSPTHLVPKPPRYPLFSVTSHDRSMVCMSKTSIIFSLSAFVTLA